MPKGHGDIIGSNGMVRVCDEQCKTCIFHPGNPMWLRQGRLKEIVDQHLKGGSLLTCHKTLPYAPEGNDPAACRGFWDAYANMTECGLIAIHLIGVDYVTINQGDDDEQDEGQRSEDRRDQSEEGQGEEQAAE